MKNAPSYKALMNTYNACPPEIKSYFGQFPELIRSFRHQYQVCLAYLFFRLEMAQNRTLYCGVVKLHRAHRQLAQSAVYSQHLTRQSFLDLFQRVFGQPLPAGISDRLKDAEKVRDRVLHGKSVGAPEMREAMHDVLQYAIQMNVHLQAKAGFKPFGDLRGFKGRGSPLDKSTTRWLLKGIGFGIR
jgi:hypothetical protein